MKRFIILILLMFSTSLLANDNKFEKYYQELTGLNKNQKYIMYLSYALGYKEGYGLTLAAIAWKESNFGKYPINIADGKSGSYSPYHVMLDYAALRHGITTSWSKSRLAERLLNDTKFAAKEALGVLKFFKSKNCNWRCQVASYNAGYAGLKSKKGRAYQEDISLRTKVLDSYFKEKFIYDKIKKIVFGGK